MERIPLPTELLRRARDLRSTATHEENLIWQLLRKRGVAGVKFRRQYPLPPYTLDFYSAELRLCVELDGLQHLEDPEADRRRDEYLRRANVRTLRFSNNDVTGHLDAVLQAILTAVAEQRRAMGLHPPPGASRHPPPLGEGKISARTSPVGGGEDLSAALVRARGTGRPSRRAHRSRT